MVSYDNYNEEHEILSVLPDGRLIVKTTNNVNVLSGDAEITITCADLTYIEAVLELDIQTQGGVTYDYPPSRHVSDNVVGTTIANLSAGTTLSQTAIVIGH